MRPKSIFRHKDEGDHLYRVYNPVSGFVLTALGDCVKLKDNTFYFYHGDQVIASTPIENVKTLKCGSKEIWADGSWK